VSLDILMHVFVNIVALELEQALEVIRLTKDNLRMAFYGSLCPFRLFEDESYIARLTSCLVETLLKPFLMVG
jgi:hypothetical protein